MNGLRIAIAALACALAPAALAAAVVVEAVQYPAWLERGGVAVPLAPGIELQGHDRLRTGADARARLRFADGSTVKLGENARFEIEQVQDGGLLRASLRVAEGAFRYATDKLRLSAGRAVTIRARNVTIGIRGTDLWGKSTDERSLVCLIEGVIAVGAEGHPTVQLDQPLDFYEVKRDQAPEVQKVNPQQLALWAQETETNDDAPVAQPGGPWRVNAASNVSRDEALALARSLRARGYPARVVGDAPGPYAVVITELAGDGEALALIRRIRTVPGVTRPTVSR
jgi:hypothetical protein